MEQAKEQHSSDGPTQDSQMSVSADESSSAGQEENSILDLIRTRKWLQNQEIEYRTAIKACELPDSPDMSDPDKLLERISGLKVELEEAATGLDLKHLMLHRLQMSHTLCTMESSVPSTPAGGGDAEHSMMETEKQKMVAELLERQTQLASEILRIHKMNEELRPNLNQLKKSNLELKTTNRELMFTLQKQKESLRQEESSGKQAEKLLRLEEDLQHSVEKADLLRHLFFCLLIGSGINWAQQPDMLELVRNLGLPLEKALSGI